MSYTLNVFQWLSVINLGMKKKCFSGIITNDFSMFILNHEYNRVQCTKSKN